MKKFKFWAIALLAMISLSASAQYKNTVFIGYNSFDGDGMEDALTGARIGYTRTFGLTDKAPVFLEASAIIQVGMLEEEFKSAGIETSSEMSYGSIHIPVNVAYRFAIGETGFAISPKAGLNISINALGETKNEVNGDKETIDWYDDLDAKNFGFGWQVGADVDYKRFVLGVTYGQDFTEFMDELKWKTFSVNLGYRF